jgi:hypothetical protein
LAPLLESLAFRRAQFRHALVDRHFGLATRQRNVRGVTRVSRAGQLRRRREQKRRRSMVS